MFSPGGWLIVKVSNLNDNHSNVTRGNKVTLSSACRSASGNSTKCSESTQAAIQKGMTVISVIVLHETLAGLIPRQNESLFSVV